MKYILLFLLLFSSLNAMEINESLRVDGYANIYSLSTTDESQKSNINGIDTSGGIQARYQVSDNILATGQIYFYEDNDYIKNIDFDVEAKWLYMDYYLGYDTTIRAGIFQFPIFSTSETSTIGYTNTFTETPLTSYGANGYEDFTGGEVLKKYFYKDFEFLLQLSYGYSSNDLSTGQDVEEVSGDTDNLAGITLKTNYKNLRLNIGYLQATTEFDDYDEKIDFKTFAFEGEADIYDYIFKVGYIKVELSDIFPDEQREYISIEHQIKDFTPYIYYSNENLSFDDTTNNIFSSQKTITNNLNQKCSAGIRYDFSTNIALKLSYTYKLENTKYERREDVEEHYDIVKAMINVIF
ncbi:MAG: hypothetical protein ACJAWW_001382 [Sulfurimonas sp.]|jgi:hypothetical protein